MCFKMCMFYYYSGMARPIVQETVIIERTITQFPRGEGTWGSPEGQLGQREQGKIWARAFFSFYGTE